MWNTFFLARPSCSSRQNCLKSKRNRFYFMYDQVGEGNYNIGMNSAYNVRLACYSVLSCLPGAARPMLGKVFSSSPQRARQLAQGLPAATDYGAVSAIAGARVPCASLALLSAWLASRFLKLQPICPYIATFCRCKVVSSEAHTTTHCERVLRQLGTLLQILRMAAVMAASKSTRQIQQRVTNELGVCAEAAAIKQ